MMPLIKQCDDILNDPRWAPRRGWHDDHRHNDRKPEYLPAMQQVRSEFADLLRVLEENDCLDGSALQLGVGECDASHAVWNAMFRRGAVSIDHRVCINRMEPIVGMNLRSWGARKFAEWSAAAATGRYDFLFIDAGHKIADIELDHAEYCMLVREGGIIAFHDAVKRPTYEEEIEVWRYLDRMRALGIEVNMIGDEVGIAWLVRE